MLGVLYGNRNGRLKSHLPLFFKNGSVAATTKSEVIVINRLKTPIRFCIRQLNSICQLIRQRRCVNGSNAVGGEHRPCIQCRWDNSYLCEAGSRYDVSTPDNHMWVPCTWCAMIVTPRRSKCVRTRTRSDPTENRIGLRLIYPLKTNNLTQFLCISNEKTFSVLAE